MQWEEQARCHGTVRRFVGLVWRISRVFPQVHTIFVSSIAWMSIYAAVESRPNNVSNAAPRRRLRAALCCEHFRAGNSVVRALATQVLEKGPKRREGSPNLKS